MAGLSAILRWSATLRLLNSRELAGSSAHAIRSSTACRQSSSVSSGRYCAVWLPCGGDRTAVAVMTVLHSNRKPASR